MKVCDADGCQAAAKAIVEDTINGVTQSMMAFCQDHANWWANFLQNSPFAVKG